MAGLLHPQLTFDEVGDRGASRAQRFSGSVRNIRHRSDGKRRCLAVAPRGGIGDHLDSMRVEICNDGWLVVGERKVDDRPGQVEWIVEREATGGPSAVSIPVRLHLSMRAVCGFPPDSTMTAESTTAYAWIWLPQETEPVPVGRLDRDGVVLLFTYGRSYLERSNAIALYLPELPLRPGPQTPLVGVVAGCIRDAAPNGWGQRVIENSLAGQGASELGLLTYLLHSGSNRIGALDFQLSAEQYAPAISRLRRIANSSIQLPALKRACTCPSNSTALCSTAHPSVACARRRPSWTGIANSSRSSPPRPTPHVQHPHQQNRRPRPPQPSCRVPRLGRDLPPRRSRSPRHHRRAARCHPHQVGGSCDLVKMTIVEAQPTACNSRSAVWTIADRNEIP